MMNKACFILAGIMVFSLASCTPKPKPQAAPAATLKADAPKPAPSPKSGIDGMTLKGTMAFAVKKAKAGQYDYIMDNLLSKECVNDLTRKYGKDKWREKFLKDKLESLPYYFGWLKKANIRTFGDKTVLTGGPKCHAEYVKVGGRYLIVNFGQCLTSM